MEVFYDKRNNRLVYIGKPATSEYWDRFWLSNKNLRQMITRGSRFVVKFTKKYLPKRSKILEGGCGIGRNVYALQKAGYDAYGVDYAEETVKKVKELFPELKIEIADVRNLPFEDEFFDGYWSLGVIEHFYEGYNEIALEMKRVLRKGGILFLTWPVISPLRKFKAKKGLYPLFEEEKRKEENFYQFALDPNMVVKFFEKIGFRLLDTKPMDGIKGLKDEIASFTLKKILQVLYNSNVLYFKILRKLLDLTLVFATHHIKLFVFRKI